MSAAKTGLITTLAVIYLLLCSPCVLSAEEAVGRNVLLISIDALRADHLSCYGYPRNTSPNIDGIAREGVLFKSAVSASNWTPPSLASIRTSVYPYKHGVFDWQDIINPDLATVDSLFKAAGYATAFMRDASPNILRSNDDRITQQAIDWIRRRKGRNFFLWIHYFGSHGPYRPPAPYDRIYLNDAYTEKPRRIKLADAHFLGFGGIPRYVAYGKENDANYYIAQYDGAISFTDSQIGVLLDELKSLGIYDDTVIVITADHGESLCGHEYYFHHGFYLYDDIIRIPLILKCDGILPRGAVMDFQARSIDIAPTILAMANIRKDDGMDGASLLPLIGGEQDAPAVAFIQDGRRSSVRTLEWKLIFTDMDRPLLDFEKSKDLKDVIGYFEWKAGSRSGLSLRGLMFKNVIRVLKFLTRHAWFDKYRFIARLKDKFILRQISRLHRYYSEEYELYNILDDPGEKHNLIGKEKEQGKALKQALGGFLSQKAYHAKKRVKMDKHMEERLSALGYLQ